MARETLFALLRAAQVLALGLGVGVGVGVGLGVGVGVGVGVVVVVRVSLTLTLTPTLTRRSHRRTPARCSSRGCAASMVRASLRRARSA